VRGSYCSRKLKLAVLSAQAKACGYSPRASCLACPAPKIDSLQPSGIIRTRLVMRGFLRVIENVARIAAVLGPGANAGAPGTGARNERG
jgi:hypothetical protein